MIAFKSDTSFMIARGKVFVVQNQEIWERGKCPYMNAEVEIDGSVYTVVGVETFPTNGPVRIGVPMGLLVKNDSI
jgi:hypothetical protein